MRLIMGEEKTTLQVCDLCIVYDIIIPTVTGRIVLKSSHIPLAVILGLAIAIVPKFVGSTCKICNVPIPGTIDGFLSKNGFQSAIATNKYTLYLSAIHYCTAYNRTSQHPAIQLGQTFQVMQNPAGP